MKLINYGREFGKGFDWALLFLAMILTFLGAVAIYSVALSRGKDMHLLQTQIIALGLGLVFLFIAASFHISFYQAAAKLIYLLSLLFLALVLLFGETIHGTTGWLRLGGFSFQPAEFAKVGLVLFLSWLAERYGRRFDKWQFVFVSGLFTFFPVALILFQPDLGSALVLIGLWLGMLFLTGVKKRHLAVLFSFFLVLFLCAWFFLFASYQKDRLLTFFNHERDPLGAGYNITQSIIAIGSGQLLGRGLGFGSQSQLHFLPEAQTDFIFSVIAEELGLVGAISVLALYFLFFSRVLNIAKKARSDFSSYLAASVVVLFFVQMTINIGAAAGFMPVIGVTLPFLSYGGSSLLVSLLLLGIVESDARCLPSS